MAAPDGRDHARPVVLGRPRPGALAPRPLEDVVHHQHRHVAADAVALRGDRAERLHDRGPQLGRERVQLDDVRPGREVRVAAVREDARRRRARTTPDRARGPRRSPRTKYSGCVGRPRMVGRDVVRHEVEDQAEPALRERRARRGEPVRPAQLRVDHVAADAVRRADHVLASRSRAARAGRTRPAPRSRARSRPRPGCAPRRPSARPRRSRARRSRPTRARERRRGRPRSLAAAQLIEPDPRVELVDERMSAHARGRYRPPNALPHRNRDEPSPGGASPGRGEPDGNRLVAVSASG